jgi:diaminohydroxyphosphoribosylaminopyrimidine deaminase/5-amino-6-(5-phosphoribosylamino)uracil reductase
MRLLGEDGIANVLVEGGGELAASLIEERLVDRFLFFIAPKIIGGKKALASVGGAGIDRIRDAACLKSVKIKRIAADILVDARA